MKDEFKRIAKFLSIGFLGTTVHAIVFYITFTFLELDSLIANTIAFLIALCFSYFGHTNFTFKDKVKNIKIDWNMRWRFFQTTFLGFILNNVWAFIFINELHWNTVIFIVSLYTLTPGIVYALHRFWVFHNLQPQK